MTNTGIRKITLDKKGTLVKSTSMPVIDPKVFYLKKVILE
jgi:hypothetical protein